MSATQEVFVQFQTQLTRASLTRPANTTAYASGDVISAATTDAHLTFSNALRPGGRLLSGSIPTARCISSANQSATALPDLELWLFHTDIATVADNAAFAPSDDELLTLIGVIDFPVADWKVGGAGTGGAGNSVCQATNLGLVLQAASTTIYGQLVARNTYTPIASERFTVDLLMTQD